MYKKMYFRLFNVVTDALEQTDITKLKEILIAGQLETEEMYISENSTITLFCDNTSQK